MPPYFEPANWSIEWNKKIKMNCPLKMSTFFSKFDLSRLAKVFRSDSSASTGPALGSLRVATHDDLPRLALVAEAGFYYSPVFRYERPHHKAYPKDTLLSYEEQFLQALGSDDHLVIAAEDNYDPHESSKTEAVIPADNGWQPPVARKKKVIVGLASLKLAPSSKLRGQYMDEKGTMPQLPPNQGRDLNREHYDGWGRRVAETRRIYCPEDSVVVMLVVHPAYWRRGHGTQLVQWGIDLSRADRVNQCVSTTEMAYKIYGRLGFNVVCKIEAPGDEDYPEGLQTHLMRLDITRSR